MVPVRLLRSEVTEAPSSLLITFWDPERVSVVDAMIKKVAGNTYHDQIDPSAQKGSLTYATGNQSGQRFRDVLFVHEDLSQPLGKLLFSALVDADQQEYDYVAIPAVRTYDMSDLEEMAKAIKTFGRPDADRNLKMIALSISNENAFTALKDLLEA